MSVCLYYHIRGLVKAMSSDALLAGIQYQARNIILVALLVLMTGPRMRSRRCRSVELQKRSWSKRRAFASPRCLRRSLFSLPAMRVRAPVLSRPGRCDGLAFRTKSQASSQDAVAFHGHADLFLSSPVIARVAPGTAEQFSNGMFISRAMSWKV